MLNNIMGCKFSKRILCTKKDFSCNNCFYDKICHNFDIMHTTIKKNDLSNINEEIKRKLNV